LSYVMVPAGAATPAGVQQQRNSDETASLGR